VPGWCGTGRHHRCYVTTHVDTIKTGSYGHRAGHVWICLFTCHANQGYPPCPHPDHQQQDHLTPESSAAAVEHRAVTHVQVNLF
jgi:hypothetical protein